MDLVISWVSDEDSKRTYFEINKKNIFLIIFFIFL